MAPRKSSADYADYADLHDGRDCAETSSASATPTTGTAAAPRPEIGPCVDPHVASQCRYNLRNPRNLRIISIRGFEQESAQSGSEIIPDQTRRPVKLTDSARFSTVCIHAGQVPDPTTGAIITPIYQTSTYVQEGLGQHKGFEYGRTQNPTRMALEGNIAAIEKRQGGVRLRLGHGGHRRHPHAARVRRPSRRQRQHLRRDVPALRAGAPEVRARLHLRGHVAPRVDRAGHQAEHQVPVHRDADQSDAADHRPAGGERDRASARTSA